MAADANVVVFERIKEEVRRGKTVRSAVNSGFARGFLTILDANILDDAHCWGPVRVRDATGQGLFALTLIIGTIVSMFTAVLAIQALLGVLSEFRFFRNPAFMGLTSAQIATGAGDEDETAPAALRRGRPPVSLERPPQRPPAQERAGGPGAAAFDGEEEAQAALATKGSTEAT